MKSAFLITARLKSTRLPKKILLEVVGKPLIVHMLDRLKRARTINKIIICTSTNPQDDPLVEVAERESVHCFRGSEDDVLKRLFDAAREHKLPYFANITADCPLTDPILVDRAIKEYNKIDSDITMYDSRNGDLPFNCYIIRTRALKKVIHRKKETDTEVWLKYFLSDSSFKIHAIEPGENYQHKSLKTSIDYPEDYEFIKLVFEELYKKNKVFSLLDVIKLVKNKPDILEINTSSVLLKRWRDHQRALSV